MNIDLLNFGFFFYCYSDSTHDSLPVGMFINKTMGFIQGEKKMAIPHPASKTTGKQIQACMRN